MNIGYARVSTVDQHLEAQLDALEKADCKRVFTDRMSGAKAERTGLAEALSHLREGDVLVVWRLDRLGRSLKHLIETVNQLDQRGVGFVSVTEHIDTTSPTGKLVFHLFGALAEFERELIRERTRAGLAAARARGREGGHPRAEALNTPQKVAFAQQLYADPTKSIDDICRTLRISRATLYRYVKAGSRPVAKQWE